MSKTYLGYGYTNENGVATLDYDPNGDELPRRSYQCRSRTATVVAETTVEGVTHSSAKMKFCEGYVPPKPVPTLSLTGSDISVGETLALSGVLSAGSGKSVKVYQGNTLIDTVTTGSGGAFTSSISNLDVGSYGFYAEFEGDGVYEEVVSSNVQITVSKITPTISLNGSDITFGEPLNLSGTLSIGSGKTVKIYKTNVLMDTVTTGSGGAFTSTLNNIDAGTYEFRAVFEGDNTYEEAISYKSIHISKLQSTITFTGSNITVGETLNLSGTLSIGNGHSVKIYQGETVIDTVTTGANGAFSKSITGLTAGTYTFKALFEGGNNYQGVMSSAVSITVVNGVLLTATKNIIQTNETTDITAQLLDTDNSNYNLNDCAGKTIHFYEQITPTINITATQNIIQTDETTDITAKVRDEDGSIPKNMKVYFYEEEE